MSWESLEKVAGEVELLELDVGCSEQVIGDLLQAFMTPVNGLWAGEAQHPGEV